MTVTEADVIADYAKAGGDPAFGQSVLDAGQPRNVIAALARVLAEIGGIGKMTSAERARRGLGGGDTGITYAYRGIDQIAAAAQPLLGKYGVVIVPTRIIESRVETFTINNRPWTDTYLRMHWTVYGPGGLDDHFGAESEGLGRDNSDKGPNKAMTAAHKNLVVRLLMIGDPASDTDGQTFERDEVPTSTGPQPLSDQWRSDFEAKVKSDGFEVADVMWQAFGNTIPDPLMPEHVPALRDAVARMKQAAEELDKPPTGELPLESATPPGERPITQPQVARIKKEYTRLAYDRDKQLKFTSGIVGRRIDTHNQLSHDEAEKVIEGLGRIKEAEATGE